jgi:hypothetical protein
MSYVVTYEEFESQSRGYHDWVSKQSEILSARYNVVAYIQRLLTTSYDDELLTFNEKTNSYFGASVEFLRNIKVHRVTLTENGLADVIIKEIYVIERSKKMAMYEKLKKELGL